MKSDSKIEAHPSFFRNQLPSFLILLLSLAMIGLVVQTTLGGAREKARKAGCMKNLYDMYQAACAYAETSVNEGGGGGFFPYKKKAKAPQDLIMPMVQLGFVFHPGKVKCPAGDGPKAEVNSRFDSKNPRPWTVGQAPFKLTDATTYYGFARKKISSDRSDPGQALAGDRWIRSEKKGAISNNHRGGRNILTSTGRVKWLKKGGADHKKYFSQLVVQLKNPKKYKEARKKWQAKIEAKKSAKREAEKKRQRARKWFQKHYDEELVKIGKKIYFHVIYGRGKLRRARKRLTVAKAIQKAPDELKDLWNQRLKKLSGEDRDKKESLARGAQAEVREEAMKKYTHLFYDFFLLLEKMLDDPSLQRDKKFNKKGMALRREISPLERALWGRSRSPKGREFLKELFAKYLSREKEKKVLEILGRIKKHK